MSDAITIGDGPAPQDSGGGGGDGSGNSGAVPGWLADAGDLAHDPTLIRFKEPKDLAKSYLEVRKLVGTDVVPRPSEDWTEEQYREWGAKIGVPDSADGYEMPEIADLPEGYVADKALFAKFAESARAHQIPPRALGGLWKDFLTHQAKVESDELTAERQRTEKWVNEQKAALGPQWNAKMDLANRTLTTAVGKATDTKDLAKIQAVIDAEYKTLVLADGTPWLSHPATFQLLSEIGDLLHEGDLLLGTPAAGSGGKSQQEIDAEVDNFERKHGKILADPSHRDHESYNKLYNELVAKKFGG